MAIEVEIKEKKKEPTTFASLIEGRNNNFDFLRFFFAVMVIYHHSWDLLKIPRTLFGQPSDYPDWIFRLSNGSIESGWTSVNCFFMISGFLITASWMYSANLFDFIKKRALRIYPAWIATLLFCIFIIGPLSGVLMNEYFRNRETYSVFKTLFLRSYYDQLPGVFLTNPFPVSVNGSLWTLPFEIKCYLLVAVLGMLKALKRKWVILALFSLVYGFYVFASIRHLNIAHIGEPDRMPRLLAYFLAGTALFLFREELPHDRKLFLISIGVIAATCLFGVAEYFMPIFGTYAVFYVAFSPRLKLQKFAKFGDFSYGLYIYSFPIQQLLIHKFRDGAGINPYALFLLTTAITLIVSFLSWHLIEKPFLALKKRTKPVPQTLSA